MLSDETFVLVFAGEEKTRQLNRSLFEDIREKGGPTELIGEGATSSSCLLPSAPRQILPILEIIPVQMVTLALAAQAGREAGIRVVLLMTAYAQAGFNQPPAEEQRRFCDASVEAYLERVEALIRAVLGDELVVELDRLVVPVIVSPRLRPVLISVAPLLKQPVGTRADYRLAEDPIDPHGDNSDLLEVGFQRIDARVVATHTNPGALVEGHAESSIEAGRAELARDRCESALVSVLGGRRPAGSRRRSRPRSVDRRVRPR